MNFNKKLAVAVSGAVLLMAGQVALADSATDIVDALVSKGVLTEEEGKLITKGHTSKTAVTPVVKEKDGAFTLESASGRNSISLTGRLHFDYRDSTTKDLIKDGVGTGDTDTRSFADTMEVRRARLGVKGQFAKDFKYEIVGNLPGTATLDVAYLDYAKFDQASIRVGKFKQPFGLEQLTSSNNIDFMERSFNDQLVPGKKLGAMIFGSPITGVTYAGSTYQKNDNANDSTNDQLSFSGRTTANLAEIMGNKDAIFHVGLAGRNETYSIVPSVSGNTSGTISTGTPTRGTIFSFQSGGRGLGNAYRAQIAGSTPTSSCVNTPYPCAAVSVPGYGDHSPTTARVNSNAVGLETILALGPVKLQGEYAYTKYNADADGTTGRNNVKADVETWYAEALWLLTGEKYSDAYKKGVFSSIKGKNEFDLDKGTWGAWELGLRADGFSVSDASISGSTNSRFQGSTSKNASTDSFNALNTASEGGAKSYTAGIKWFLNPNTRVLLNYTYTKFDHAFTPIDISGGTRNVIDDEKIMAVRTQFMF